MVYTHIFITLTINTKVTVSLLLLQDDYYVLHNDVHKVFFGKNNTIDLVSFRA